MNYKQHIRFHYERSMTKLKQLHKYSVGEICCQVTVSAFMKPTSETGRHVGKKEEKS